MTEAFNQHEEDDPLEEMRDLTAQWANYFNGIQQVLGDYERLQQRVAALESENAALTDTVEQWKNNDEWSNRVTYDNVVDQIASLEDASKRDDARRLIEALLKKSQVTQFRRDIKHRVRCLLAAPLGLQLPGGCQGVLPEDTQSEDGHRRRL